MKNILNKININFLTYYFLIICFICGFIKNAIIIYFIVIIHELGHIIIIKLLKYEIIKIEIYPFGGITKINKKINSKIINDIFISINGVLFQFFIIKLLCYYLNFNSSTLNIINEYNKTILLFNILPIIPLDGSKLLEALLNMFFSYKKSYYITIISSIIFIILFINYNILNSFNNYLIILILIYYTYRYYKDFKYIFNRFLIERILYKIPYKKIKYNTKSIYDLRKEYRHYFKEKNNYISEESKIKEKFT